MLNPPIDVLLEKLENRYSLVITASKRARQLIESEGEPIMKPVSVAIDEIMSGKIDYTKAE